MYDLLSAGDTITGTALATAYGTRLKVRLKDPFIEDTVALILDIRTELTNRTSKYGDVDTLTLAQQTLVKAVARQMSRARETAKRAFKGSKIKLHDEFCVNQNTKTIGKILGDARIVLASLKKTDNVGPLTDKGWLDTDTTKLDDAITAATTALQSETDGQGDPLGETSVVNFKANNLYDRLLDIQQAADLEWPVDDPANVAVRAKFLLGVFPYSGGSGGSTPPPTPPTPPAPAK